MVETWLPVVGFEDSYEVSSLGGVRSKDRVVHRSTSNFKRTGMPLIPQLDGDGYPKVSLGRANQRRVHILVARAFIPNPDGLPEVDHEDTNKVNCRVDNLRWCTKKGNAEYRHAKTYRTCEVKFGPEHRRAVQAAVTAGTPIMHIAKALGMSRSHVRRLAELT